MITKKDLISSPKYEVLYCNECDYAVSANRGDSFTRPDSYEFLCDCCNKPLVLAVPYKGYRTVKR